MSVSNANNHSLRLSDDNGELYAPPKPKNPPDKLKPRVPNHLPQRYTVKTNGEERALICQEAPNLNVHIENGLSISGSVARKSPPGTIFLDGVAQCEPFMDHERQVYNLDHHEGCVRAFTLSACEQALVMYMKGLDLQSREWHIFANEPDLDTILALWIILNHARIGGLDMTQRRILFALVRYEGIIDALGLELKELSALPPELIRKIQRVVDHLRSDEIALKKEGRWTQTDFLGYTAGILHKIDLIFYKASDFADYQGIEELARIDLSDQRICAVVEADMGIYEIEPHLTKLYGNRLGVVFLKKGKNSYTVRLMDLFMPIALEDIYDRLNYVDPAVKCRTRTNRWGGADDIGGSPRETGTGLAPGDIAQACRDAVRKLSLLQQLGRFASTSALIGLVVLCAHIVRLYWSPAAWLNLTAAHTFWNQETFGFAVTILLGTSISLAFIAFCQPWQYGWIWPSGRKWWLLLPLSLLAGSLGGVWMPESLATGPHLLSSLLIAGLAMPLAAELLFRGLALGLLAQHLRSQRDDTQWFVSGPAIFSTMLYVGFMALLLIEAPPDGLISGWRLGYSLVAAAFFGLTAAMVRERSQSILPAILFHILAAGVAYCAIRLV
jgi:membrane protease YdiL (CAAX protease family)